MGRKEFLLWCSGLIKNLTAGVPAVAQWNPKHLGSTRMGAAGGVQSPARHSGLRIWHRCSLGGDCSSDLIPSPGNSICLGAAKNEKKKKKKASDCNGLACCGGVGLIPSLAKLVKEYGNDGCFVWTGAKVSSLTWKLPYATSEAIKKKKREEDVNIFPKKIYILPKDTWKDALHCSSSGKCKSIPQYYFIPVGMSIIKKIEIKSVGKESSLVA